LKELQKENDAKKFDEEMGVLEQFLPDTFDSDLPSRKRALLHDNKTNKEI
jgi:hypothetical protein